jgi:hypothetical protein
VKVVGIDPGLTGGVAAYDGTTLFTYELKPVKAKTGRGRQLPWPDVALDYECMFGGIEHVYIEEVGAMGSMEGASSVFKFGYVAGCLAGIVYANGAVPVMVRPQTWKGFFGLVGVGKSKKEKKDKAIAKAVELFPDNEKDFFGPRGGGKDGVAEAALIAWYGYSQVTE